MKKERIFIFCIAFLCIIVVVISLVYKNRKNKIDLLLKSSENVYSFFSMQNGSINNVNAHLKNTIEENGEIVDSIETFVYNDITKSIFNDIENSLKYTDIYYPNNSIRYMESYDGETKIMCNTNFDREEYFEPFPENILYEYQEYKSISLQNIFEIIVNNPVSDVKISRNKLDDIDCYLIKSDSGHHLQYVNAETLLPIKTIDEEMFDENGEKITQIVNFEIEYNVVNENDVQKLDETGFILVSEKEFEELF